MSGIKTHPRSTATAMARIDLVNLLMQWESKHGLTKVESLYLLQHECALGARDLLRLERHGDVNKKADEA